MTPRINDADYAQLTEHIQGLLANVEELPFPKVKEEMFDLLHCLDLLHREALTRLVELIAHHAPQLQSEIDKDYALQTVLMLYGFVPVEEQPRPSAGISSFIALDQIGVMAPIKMPVWIPAGNLADLAEGQLLKRSLEGEDVLLCRVAGEMFALQNNCLDSILPLDRGRLEGTILHCPWHGCQYDIRTGEIQNGSGLRLKQYPILLGEAGKMRIGFNIPAHMMPVRETR